MALQPINIKVTDDVENYITAEMDAKIYSQLVSEGIAKDVGNACKVVIGENDIKIQNGLFNIGGYFASIKDFHSISKPVQNDFYVKAKFVKGVSQDEFTIYTDTNKDLVQQDLFNGGSIRELLIAEVHNKNEVTMHSVNSSLAEIRNVLQNILDAENRRSEAEIERITKEQERQRLCAETISRVEQLIQTLTETDSNLKNEEQKRVQAESVRAEKISNYLQKVEELKTIKDEVDSLQKVLIEKVEIATKKINEIQKLNNSIAESEEKRAISEIERERKINEFNELIQKFDGTSISNDLNSLKNKMQLQTEKINLINNLFLENKNSENFFALKKIDGKICIVLGKLNEISNL